MKKMIKWIAVAFVGLLLALMVSDYRYKKLYAEYSTVSANIKSLDNALNRSKSDCRGLQLTIDQLNASRDSVTRQMIKIKDSLRVKNKNIKSLLYTSSNFSRTDTIVTVDTLFRDSQVSIDSIFGDAWYKMRVQIKYPNFISLSPFFISKKYVVVSSKKETINPPKKFFLFRWFQHKHKVIQINITEMNPYVENDDSKYIEIIK